jgi:hypothetical protein
MCEKWFPHVKITFVYISEAHATDKWPIGMSAGVENKTHHTIEDRTMCATKFVQEYDFTIPTYLDNMNDELRDGLAAWPFRFYLVSFNNETQSFIFDHIAMPDDSEFDFSILFDLLSK